VAKGETSAARTSPANAKKQSNVRSAPRRIDDAKASHRAFMTFSPEIASGATGAKGGEARFLAKGAASNNFINSLRLWRQSWQS
jgi:hypothetical protein